MSTQVVVNRTTGAGNSTVVSVIADRAAPSALVSGDVFLALVLSGRIAPWLPEAHVQNEIMTKIAAAAACRYAWTGFTTVRRVVGP